MLGRGTTPKKSRNNLGKGTLKENRGVFQNHEKSQQQTEGSKGRLGNLDEAGKQTKM